MATKNSKFEDLNWMSDTSLVLGIVSLAISILSVTAKAAFPLAGASLVFGILPLVIKQIKGNKSKAIFGIALSGIAIIIAIIVLVRADNAWQDISGLDIPF